MPILQVFTNIASKSIPSEFSKAAKIIANLTGKKEASVMVGKYFFIYRIQFFQGSS